MFCMARNCRDRDWGRVGQNWSQCGGPGNEGTAESRRVGYPTFHIFNRITEEVVAVSIIWAEAGFATH